MYAIWILLGILGVAVATAMLLFAAVLRPRVRSRRAAALLADVRKLFHIRREWLEARFVTCASTSGKPRGLSWVDCDFEDDVSFARDRNSGALRALVGITIRFEAIEGGGMEEVAAVGNLRAATAVFRYDGKHWETDGRAIFNLNPSEAIRHYHQELETVD